MIYDLALGNHDGLAPGLQDANLQKCEIRPDKGNVRLQPVARRPRGTHLHYRSSSFGGFSDIYCGKKYYSPRVQQHPLQAGLVDQRLFGGNCRQK